MPAGRCRRRGRSASLAVRNTRRYSAIVWFIAAVIAGSNCPISGPPERPEHPRVGVDRAPDP